MKQDGKFILLNCAELKPYIESLKGCKIFKTIQQHHTSSPSYKDFKNNHFELMKGMENYHVNTVKMSEVAQHFSTFPDGTICVGRPLTKDGGGFLGKQNTNAITLEHVGNFDSDVMTEEQKKSIILLNALLCIKFSITPSTVSLPYHCWVKNKSCPGTKFFGGNTRAVAEKNFIPLIKTAMVEPMTYEQAIKIVAEKVDTPASFWLKKRNIDPSFEALIIKMAKYIKGGMR
jgi:hypothetical protein